MSSKIKLNRVLTPKTKKGQRDEDKPGEKALAGLIEKKHKRIGDITDIICEIHVVTNAEKKTWKTSPKSSI